MSQQNIERHAIPKLLAKRTARVNAAAVSKTLDLNGYPALGAVERSIRENLRPIERRFP